MPNTHEIHTSERKSFKACRRKWNWIFRENYYPTTTAKPLEFGIAYHKAMETFYNPETWKMDREVIGELAVKVFVDECEKQRRAFLQDMDSTYLEEDVQQDYDDRVELGSGMLRYYYKKIHPVVDKGFKPIDVEVAFEVPIPNPETGEPLRCKCHNEIIYYAGRIDMLAEDDFGDYWIFDWKTAARLSGDNDEYLYLDDQISSYVWALRKKLNLPVQGFVYVEQKKGFPQEPKPNKTRRLGCLYSVSKTQEVEYETYLQAIKENDTDAYQSGAYDEYLEWLKVEGPKFYDRFQIVKSPKELEEIEYNLSLEAMDMTDPDLRIYPSAGRFGCNFCAFRQVCLGKNMQEDYVYTLETLFEKREHYYVRENETTEQKEM